MLMNLVENPSNFGITWVEAGGFPLYMVSTSGSTYTWTRSSPLPTSYIISFKEGSSRLSDHEHDNSALLVIFVPRHNDKMTSKDSRLLLSSSPIESRYTERKLMTECCA